MSEPRRHFGHGTLRHAALVVITVAFAGPLAWMVLTSVTPEAQVMDPDAGLLPRPISAIPEYAADSYGRVLGDDVVQFPVYLRNTLHVALLAVAGTVAASAVVAYGFARVRWRGRDTVFAITLMTMMIPFPVIMVPLYVIFRSVGWVGSFKPLWVPAWFGGAFSIFLLRQFYRRIPRELDDAARIDGCGHVGIFWHVILPLTRPALAVVALLQFMFVWNDFLGPLIFLTDRDQFTLALGLHLYQSQQGSTPWNLLMAASTLFVLPVLVLFLLAQKAIMDGIALGGTKG